MRAINPMRAFVLPIIFALSLPAGAALAQSSPPPPGTGPGPMMPPGPAGAMTAAGITRDQFIQRAQERVARAAGARFDEMDANHDGVLTRDEMRAYRAAHPRGSRMMEGAPAPGLAPTSPAPPPPR